MAKIAVLEFYQSARAVCSFSCADTELGVEENTVEATIEVHEIVLFKTKESACGIGRPSVHPRSWCFGLRHRETGRVVLMVTARGHAQLLSIKNNLLRAALPFY